MKLFNLQLIIPTGERAVVFKAPLKCESLGIILTTDMHADYNAEQRLGLYKQLLDSLGHLYHSAKVMTPEVAERMLTVVEEIKAIDAPLLLEHGWEANFASTDQLLEFKFTVTEVDEHGVPIDADEPNGFVVARLEKDDFTQAPFAVAIKKHMSLDDRKAVYARIFEHFKLEEDDGREAWFKQLDGIFKREDYPILASTYWNRNFRSGDFDIDITYRPLNDLKDLCEFEGVNGLYMFGGEKTTFRNVEELPDEE